MSADVAFRLIFKAPPPNSVLERLGLELNNNELFVHPSDLSRVTDILDATNTKFKIMGSPNALVSIVFIKSHLV
jgi:hypothetical protein